jgi:PAS domain S-box-containing protein
MNEQEHKKTILLVKDEAVIAMMEEKALSKHGFNVIIASSGVNAINAVQNTPDIDLILIDVNLGKGKMDGTEAAEIILKERDIPVLFLSSYTHAEVVQKTERITSYGYVTKDSGETVLIASIKMAFKLHEAHRRLRESEEALQKSEEKYRQLSENAYDFILSMDLDGIIQYANRAACDLASPLKPIGLSMQDITPPNFSQNIPELLRKRREGDDSIFAFEWEIVTPDSYGSSAKKCFGTVKDSFR